MDYQEFYKGQMCKILEVLYTLQQKPPTEKQCAARQCYYLADDHHGRCVKARKPCGINERSKEAKLRYYGANWQEQQRRNPRPDNFWLANLLMEEEFHDLPDGTCARSTWDNDVGPASFLHRMIDYEQARLCERLGTGWRQTSAVPCSARRCLTDRLPDHSRCALFSEWTKLCHEMEALSQDFLPSGGYPSFEEYFEQRAEMSSRFRNRKGTEGQAYLKAFCQDDQPAQRPASETTRENQRSAPEFPSVN